MRSEIRISNRSGVAVIDIEGVIGVPEKMQFDRPEERVATYDCFTEVIKQISSIGASEIVVNIRSTGGDVNDALLIYEALCSLDAVVTTRCLGYVASAATIIAQAASEGCRQVSANTLYLVHCSESSVEGNSLSLSRTKELLEATDMRIANIYSLRSGRDLEEFVALMGQEGGRGRWMTAEETVAAGLADVIIPAGRSDAFAERGVARAEVEKILDMLELPPLPDDESVAGNPASPMWLRRILSLLRKFLSETPRKQKTVKEPKKKRDAVADRAAGIPPADSTVVLERLTRQATARPTRTKAKEDPSMDEYRPTANQQAYENDIRNIRIG